VNGGDGRRPGKKDAKEKKKKKDLMRRDANGGETKRHEPYGPWQGGLKFWEPKEGNIQRSGVLGRRAERFKPGAVGRENEVRGGYGCGRKRVKNQLKKGRKTVP